MRISKSPWISRLGIGALAIVGLGVVSLQSTPAEARAWFDLGLPTYVVPPPYYAYARPADFSPKPTVAGAMIMGFGGGHYWQ